MTEAREPTATKKRVLPPTYLLASIVAMVALRFLLPALSRVREQGRAVACRSNLRQWGVILAMYTNEHDGKYFASPTFA